MPSGRRRSLSTGTPVLQPPSSGLLSRGLTSLRRHHRHTSEQLNDTSRQALPSLPSGNTAPSSQSHRVTSSEPESCAKSHIRLIPELGLMGRAFVFEVIERSLCNGNTIRLGRYSDRTPTCDKISFKSKVVSRCHAEIWLEDTKVFIRDSGSSSGTFLNHVRLGSSGSSNRGGPHELKDGDLIQLGVDYKDGAESIYRAVKIRLEINREWQSRANQFSRTTFQHLQQCLTGPTSALFLPDTSRTCSKADSNGESEPQDIQECCICMYAIAPLQALFITPCSHMYHYRCIRPILEQNPPGFSCPLCRTYSDLEATVAVEVSEVMEMLGLNSQEELKPSHNSDDKRIEDIPEDGESSATEEESTRASHLPVLEEDISSSPSYAVKESDASLFRAKTIVTDPGNGGRTRRARLGGLLGAGVGVGVGIITEGETAVERIIDSGEGLLSTTLVGSPPTFGRGYSVPSRNAPSA
ncbi:hypothetical protein BDF14DRAFT_1731201 [Spinellus fusiger]|nr:hypothetical protein BDF14DRAFT_1731201 [Spinellus fusiger]